MSQLMQRLLNRVYMAPEGDDGSSGGSASPAADDSSSSDDSAVDWAELNANIAPGADDDEQDPENPAPAAKPVAKPADEADPANSTNEENPADPEPELDADGNPLTPVVPDEPAETPEQAAARQEKLNKDFTEWTASETERLSNEVYVIDEDTASRLLTEPELVLPKLAAQVQMETMKATLAAVQRMIPMMLPQVLQSTDVEKQATDLFYGKNPDLKKYHKQVMQAGKMFRELNPKATPEEAADKIGMIVRSSLGLKTVPKADGAPQGKPAVTAGKKPAPHKPAAAGGTGSAAPGASKGDPTVWDDMSSDD